MTYRVRPVSRYRAFPSVQPRFLRGQRLRLWRIRHPWWSAFLAVGALALLAVGAAALTWWLS